MLRHFKMAKEQHIRKAVLRVRKNKEFFIWCDESDSRGKFYSNFYGGVLVESQHIYQVQRTLTRVCRELHFYDEIKWHKVSKHYVDKYMQLMDAFFQLIGTGKIKLRIMFTQNSFDYTGLIDEHKSDEFLILYYHFIKHAFGLSHCNKTKEDIHLRLFFDQLPLKHEKRAQFKRYIKELQSLHPFKLNRLKIRKQDIIEVNSKRHLLVQLVDVVLGSICFRLNNKHREIPEGKKRRGKRTIAKEKLYKHIFKKIKEINPKFVLGTNTPTKRQEDYWLDLYRHWNFKSSEYEIDSPYTNKKRSILTA